MLSPEHKTLMAGMSLSSIASAALILYVFSGGALFVFSTGEGEQLAVMSQLRGAMLFFVALQIHKYLQATYNKFRPPNEHGWANALDIFSSYAPAIALVLMWAWILFLDPRHYLTWWWWALAFYTTVAIEALWRDVLETTKYVLK